MKCFKFTLFKNEKRDRIIFSFWCFSHFFFFSKISRKRLEMFSFEYVLYFISESRLFACCDIFSFHLKGNLSSIKCILSWKYSHRTLFLRNISQFNDERKSVVSNKLWDFEKYKRKHLSKARKKLQNLWFQRSFIWIT